MVKQSSKSAAAPTIYVVDDSSEMRRSVHALLDSFGYCAWPFASARDFLEQLDALEPAPVLVDLRMPAMDGIQLMEELKRRGIDWPTIVMTGHGEIAIAVKAMKLGAIDFLEKPFPGAALERALDHAWGKLAQAAESSRRRREAAASFARLTRREVDIVKLLARGLPNKAIANELGLSVRTVEMHRGNAQTKLNVRNLAELVTLASEAGYEARP